MDADVPACPAFQALRQAQRPIQPLPLLFTSVASEH